MDEEVPADVDEPPDNHLGHDLPSHPDFHKSLFRPTNDRKESLLTKALTQTETEITKPNVQISSDLTRRRSMLSNASIASTAELTSDGGLTSPARTNTPSPPPPSSAYTSFGPYSFTSKTMHLPEPLIAKIDANTPTQTPEAVSISPKAQPLVEAAPPKKRCISFACAPGTVLKPKPTPIPVVEQAPAPSADVVVPKKRVCMIKFACTAPKPSEKAKVLEDEIPSFVAKTTKPVMESPKRTSRSPVAFRKSPRSTQPQRPARESHSVVRRSSQSPVATRYKPKYIIADEKTLKDSEATRFHEFASGELQEDDWIRKDEENPRAKLTINDTLKKENDIRRLGNEAEEEALEEDREEEDEDNDSDELEDDEDEEDEDEDEDEEVSDDYSDGNETDNEAGFAESDESDGEGEFAFWTPGRSLLNNDVNGASTYRPSAYRTASASSIDSLGHMSPPEASVKSKRSIKHRPIKIRPGTPDLPDSTDFVCGTLDEDRPLENAYVSCMAQRKNAKHKQTPQDIDPSFPTSDISDEEDDDDLVDTARSSDENLWIHGKFEDSDGDGNGRRRSSGGRRKSPGHSPRRLHSPPPAKRLRSPPPPKQRLHSPPPKQRLRSPPARQLFGAHSPRRMHSPPARHVASPAASPSSDNAVSMAIPFAPLGSRPGLTHTKSLPRTPNAFCRQYHASRLAAANGNDGVDGDGHVRAAIDIVRGLEQKRQRRKEKLHPKAGKGKVHTERKPQPGKGAERMRELGLFIANKTGRTDPYILSA